MELELLHFPDALSTMQAQNLKKAQDFFRLRALTPRQDVVKHLSQDRLLLAEVSQLKASVLENLEVLAILKRAPRESLLISQEVSFEGLNLASKLALLAANPWVDSLGLQSQIFKGEFSKLLLDLSQKKLEAALITASQYALQAQAYQAISLEVHLKELGLKSETIDMRLIPPQFGESSWGFLQLKGAKQALSKLQAFNHAPSLDAFRAEAQFMQLMTAADKNAYYTSFAQVSAEGDLSMMAFGYEPKAKLRLEAEVVGDVYEGQVLAEELAEDMLEQMQAIR
ncbi:MAG: hypothetical protein R2880_19155 [Deinococcales bacterium]